MSDSISQYNRYSSTRFYGVPKTSPKTKNKAIRVRFPCHGCGTMTLFFMEENPKLCGFCGLEFVKFKLWEKIHGIFTGWKSVADWERRHDV